MWKTKTWDAVTPYKYTIVKAGFLSVDGGLSYKPEDQSNRGVSSSLTARTAERERTSVLSQKGGHCFL